MNPPLTLADIAAYNQAVAAQYNPLLATTQPFSPPSLIPMQPQPGATYEVPDLVPLPGEHNVTPTDPGGVPYNTGPSSWGSIFGPHLRLPGPGQVPGSVPDFTPQPLPASFIVLVAAFAVVMVFFSARDIPEFHRPVLQRRITA